ncbi:MAG: flagellar basal body-associated FliL family protein [Pseudomonadota bacterium]
MADPKTETEGNEEDKKPSSMGFILGLVIVTGIAVGAGWFLGGQFVPKPDDKEMLAEVTKNPDELKKDDADSEEMEEGYKKTEDNPVVKLDPIIVALRDSENAFLRLELAVVTGKDEEIYGDESKLRIVDAISTYSKTLSIKQISGPSGYLHFREDVLDVARLSTEGAVKDILILSMVAE